MTSRGCSRKNKLALFGGKPVRTQPWSAGPFHGPEEWRTLRRVLAGPALPLALGPHVMEFRRRIAALYGVRPERVITTSSGTTAIHVALAAAGVGPGDEVITSPLTDFGSVSGILQLQAVPVFCDVVPRGLTIDPSELERLITTRTRVIMPVHNGGYPADMPAIMRVARRHGLQVLEDCAQAHGARIGGIPLGRFGDFGAFSTNESKHMKTGEGGFILFRRGRDARFAELFADKSYDRAAKGPMNPAFPAINARMSEINAALGAVQIRRLPGWVRRRNDMGRRMDAVLRRYPLIPHWRPAGAFCSYWWCAFSLDERRAEFSAEEFRRALAAEGIPCARQIQRFVPDFALFQSLNRQPNHFRTYRPGTLKRGAYGPGICPRARWAFENMLSVRVNQHTGASELHDLDRALDKIFRARPA